MDTEWLGHSSPWSPPAISFGSGSTARHAVDRQCSHSHVEEQLACTLFVRNKAGTVLTPAGRQFQNMRHPSFEPSNKRDRMLEFRWVIEPSSPWEAASGCGEHLLLRWLRLMQETAPTVSLRAEIGFEEDLMQRLIEGRIDIGVMYTPQRRPGLNVELLLEERTRVRIEYSDVGTQAREGLCVHRLGAGVLCEAQRQLSRVRQSWPVGQYRLARVAAYPGEQRLRLFSAPSHSILSGNRTPSSGPRREGAYVVYSTEGEGDSFKRRSRACVGIAAREAETVV